MFSYLILFLLLPIIQSDILNISTAIINTPTVISCGVSIDIHPSFDPIQVMICPHVLISKTNLELIYMNITIDNFNQILIQSKPSIKSPPKYFLKQNNNSFISPKSINKNFTYYLSFSSQLICRYSFINNETICFYFPISTDFFQIEYHYDEIQHGSLILSNKSRYGFYTIFIIISILIVIICIVALCMLYTNEYPLHHTTELNSIIDTYMAKQEAAKRPPEPLQDGGMEHGLKREAHVQETHRIE